MTTTKETPMNETEAKRIIDFGTGRYSNTARELYNDSQRLLGLTSEQAERLAKAASSELGRFAPKVDITFGKLNKDFGCTLREAAKIKVPRLTYALTLMRLVAGLNDMKKLGVETFAPTLRQDMVDWLDKKLKVDDE